MLHPTDAFAFLDSARLVWRFCLASNTLINSKSAAETASKAVRTARETDDRAVA